jgi:hypothetical protein
VTRQDIAVTLCDYCWREALDRAFENGPPGWLSLAYPGAGICGTRYAVRVGKEYEAWVKAAAPDRRCVTVSRGDEYDDWACCATHLVKLAEQLRGP